MKYFRWELYMTLVSEAVPTCHTATSIMCFMTHDDLVREDCWTSLINHKPVYIRRHQGSTKRQCPWAGRVCQRS